MNGFYTTKIIKVGSSKGIVLPKDILAGTGWDRGDTLTFGVIEGPTLVIRQITPQEIVRLKPVRDIKY